MKVAGVRAWLAEVVAEFGSAWWAGACGGIRAARENHAQFGGHDYGFRTSNAATTERWSTISDRLMLRGPH